MHSVSLPSEFIQSSLCWEYKVTWTSLPVCTAILFPFSWQPINTRCSVWRGGTEIRGIFVSFDLSSWLCCNSAAVLNFDYGSKCTIQWHGAYYFIITTVKITLFCSQQSETVNETVDQFLEYMPIYWLIQQPQSLNDPFPHSVWRQTSEPWFQLLQIHSSNSINTWVWELKRNTSESYCPLLLGPKKWDASCHKLC